MCRKVFFISWILLSLLLWPAGLQPAQAENPATLKSDCEPRGIPWLSTLIENKRLRSSEASGSTSLSASNACAGVSAVSDDDIEQVRGREIGENFIFTLRENPTTEQGPSTGGGETPGTPVDTSPGDGTKKKREVLIHIQYEEHYHRERDFSATIQHGVELKPLFFSPSTTPGGFSSTLIQHRMGQ